MKEYEIMMLENSLKCIDDLIKRRYYKNNNVLNEFNIKIENIIQYFYQNKDVFKSN
jgi:hypothetical protein